MAIELLLRKEDTKPLGVNWVQKFLSRHPDIKTQYMRIGPELFAPPKPPTPRKRVRRPQLIVILRVGKRGLHYIEQVEHMEHVGYDVEQMEHMEHAEHAEQYTSRHGRQIKKTYKATT